jgi:phage terminase small subunit
MRVENGHPPVAKRYQVVIPEDANFGPAMSELTEQQQKFVLAYFQIGGKSVARAAEAAGYYGGGSAAKVAGHRLMKNPKVMEAMKEEALLTLDRGAIVAIHAMIEIAASPTHKDRQKAAADLMDRRGFIRVTGQAITVEDKRTDAELIEYIRATALKHRLDPKLLLGSDAVDITPPAKRDERNKRGKHNVAQADAVTEAENEQPRSEAEIIPPDEVADS